MSHARVGKFLIVTALTLAAAVLAALALPAAGLGHATMKASTPGVQGRVETAPRAIILEFDQAVTATDKSIEVRTAKGRLVSKPATQGPDDQWDCTTQLPPAVLRLSQSSIAGPRLPKGPTMAR